MGIDCGTTNSVTIRRNAVSTRGTRFGVRSNSLAIFSSLVASAGRTRTFPRRPRRTCRRFRQADQIRQQLVGPAGSGRQLAPEAKPEVEPSPLAVFGFDQRAEFLARIVGERIHQDRKSV